MRINRYWASLSVVMCTAAGLLSGCASPSNCNPYPGYPPYQAYPYGAPIQPSPMAGAAAPGQPVVLQPNTGVPGTVPPTYPVQPGYYNPATQPILGR